MKKVLITGKNSYVGTSFKKWVEENHPGEIQIDLIGTKNEEWKTKSFTNYDTILHLAGIVHNPSAAADEHKKINTELTVEIASKAKKENVRQFIFISTMSVYGKSTGTIYNSTDPQPSNDYGKSKLEAEKKITMLEEPNFKILILRPPMIYGENCPGNYAKLSRFIKKIPFFFVTENKRSVIHINVLSEYLLSYILDERSGILHPQNTEYMSIDSLVKIISHDHGKTIFTLKVPKIIFDRLYYLNKIFGDLNYDFNIDNDQVKGLDALHDTMKQTGNVK